MSNGQDGSQGKNVYINELEQPLNPKSAGSLIGIGEDIDRKILDIL